MDGRPIKNDFNNGCPIQKTTILAQIPHGDLLNGRQDGFQGILGQGLEILRRLLASV